MLLTERDVRVNGAVASAAAREPGGLLHAIGLRSALRRADPTYDEDADRCG